MSFVRFSLSSSPRLPSPARLRGLLVSGLIVGLAATAAAQSNRSGQGSKKQAAAQAPAGATLLESFGDWGAYATPNGRTRICYALAQPKERLPKSLNRDPGYLFVSFRKPENVSNEVAMVLGFPMKEDASDDMKLDIGRTSFPLLGKGSNAWLKDPALDSQAVAAMGKGQSATVTVLSARGNKSTDRYGLSGFSKALERARAECR